MTQNDLIDAYISLKFLEMKLKFVKNLLDDQLNLDSIQLFLV